MECGASIENQRFNWGEQALHTTHQYESWRASQERPISTRARSARERCYTTGSFEEKHGRRQSGRSASSLDGVSVGREERSWMRKFDEDQKHPHPQKSLLDDEITHDDITRINVSSLSIRPVHRYEGLTHPHLSAFPQRDGQLDRKSAINLEDVNDEMIRDDDDDVASKTERSTQAAAVGRRARTVGRDAPPRSSPSARHALEATPSATPREIGAAGESALFDDLRQVPTTTPPRERRVAPIEPAQAQPSASASTSSSPSRCTSSSSSASRIHLLRGKNGRIRAIERPEAFSPKGLRPRSSFWKRYLEAA